MKKKFLKVLFLVMFLQFMLLNIVYAGGKVKVVVNDLLVEKGEAIGAYLVLDGDGKYDVYAALTGGVLGNKFYLFTQNGKLVEFNGDVKSLPKLRANLDFSKLPVKEKIIILFPKIPLNDTSSLKGTYTFYAALCTPGKLDFPVIDQISFEVK